MKHDGSAKVREQVERLQNQSFREIESAVARKRIAWVRDNRAKIQDPCSFTPRQAYELLFFDYMGLSPSDLPVVKETETEIAWQSKNDCPTLEACRELGLDTRKVCRSAYEKSTQAFLSQIDPRLRFLRSYTEIRPFAPHCLERIVRVDFEGWMGLAIEEAMTSRQAGNKGYGALVAYGDQVVARAHDTAVTEVDPSLHAEVNAIRQAVRALGDPDLSGCILVSTCEPCPMCASLAVWANLTTLVYGASIEDTARLGKARIRVGAQEIASRSPAAVEIVGSVLAEACLALYA